MKCLAGAPRQSLLLAPRKKGRLDAELRVRAVEAPGKLQVKLIDTSLIKRYSLFVLEVVKAHVATVNGDCRGGRCCPSACWLGDGSS